MSGYQEGKSSDWRRLVCVLRQCIIHMRKMGEIVWKELGEDLLVICLDMDMEEQMGRIRSRHSGDEKVVERMKTVYNLCQPADLDASNTYEVKIDGGKSPLNVLRMVVEEINTR